MHIIAFFIDWNNKLHFILKLSGKNCILPHHGFPFCWCAPVCQSNTVPHHPGYLVQKYACSNYKLHFPVCCHNTFYVCSIFYELFGNEENSKLAETYKINVKCTVWQVTGFLKNYNTTLNFKYTKNQKITFKWKIQNNYSTFTVWYDVW